MENKDRLKQVNEYIKKYGLKEIITEDLINDCEIIVFAKGDYIAEADREAVYFYFFVEGKAKIYTLLENGKKLLLRFYSPFNILGDIEVINGNKYKVYAQALEECVCIGLPMRIASTQGLKNPDFLRFLCNHLVEKLDTITHKSSMNMLYSLEIRLASYLMQSYNKESAVFVVESNYADLAELLGTSYRHLNRTLISMEEKGILQKRGRQIRLIKVDELMLLGKEMYE